MAAPRTSVAKPAIEKRPRKRRGLALRDAEQTKQRLLDAAGGLLARHGFTALGVNAVAEEAGVDKVLIYRYFGGFAGLLEAYAEAAAFWPTTDQLVGRPREEFMELPVAERLVVLLHNYIRELRRRPVTHGILAWEVVARNELTARLEEVREKRGLELLGLLRDAPPEVDLAALLTLVSGAVQYLLMRSRLIRVFLGIDLRTDEGWARIEKMFALFIRTLFEAALSPHAASRAARARDDC
jgi:AcrR family transcriptional regulator